MKKVKLESGESAAPPKPRPKFKHTPGPWTAVKHGAIRGGDWIELVGGKVQPQIALACSVGDGTETQIANARLIAAAPDLLAELEHAHDMIKHYLKAGYLPHMSAEEAEQLVRNPDSAILRAREGR